jgi:hypothetical protein
MLVKLIVPINTRRIEGTTKRRRTPHHPMSNFSILDLILLAWT